MKQLPEATCADFDRIRQQFSYCPVTGVLTRVTGPERFRGIAGTKAGCGYLVVKIDGKMHMVHRVIVLLMTGDWPKGVVDHMDGAKLNNAWTNLRDVSVRVNQQNRRKPGARNKTGHLGVSRRNEGLPFVAHISIDGKNKNLGGFDTAEQAGRAYLDAKRSHHAGCTL